MLQVAVIREYRGARRSSQELLEVAVQTRRSRFPEIPFQRYVRDTKSPHSRLRLARPVACLAKSRSMRSPAAFGSLKRSSPTGPPTSPNPPHPLQLCANLNLMHRFAPVALATLLAATAPAAPLRTSTGPNSLHRPARNRPLHRPRQPRRRAPQSPQRPRAPHRRRHRR